MWEQDRFADTSHTHLEWKEIVTEEHKAIDTGRKDQQMPNSLFSF